MTEIKHRLALLAAAGLLAGAPVVAHGPAAPAQESTRDSTVTLTSCVAKAENDGDKFVLTHLADVPDHPAVHGRVVYWVDDVSQIKPHVGAQVRLTGTILDVRASEMEVKLGAGDGPCVVVAGNVPDVKTPPPNAEVSTANQSSREREIPTTVVKLKIDRVDVVAETCKLGA